MIRATGPLPFVLTSTTPSETRIVDERRQADVELERWLELELPCEMTPPPDGTCPRAAVWRLVRWCGCAELSCEPCYTGWVAWIDATVRRLALTGQALIPHCQTCGSTTTARAMSDVLVRVDKL